MNLETNRLITFANWPTSAPVDSIRIAKAGFFYTGQGTEVQCFSCGGKISDWNYGDQVMGRHRQLDPNCTFVGNPQLSGNVPLVVGNDCPSVVDTNPSSSIRSAGEENPESNDSSQDYGLNEDDEMYKSDALRLLSFINWTDTSVSREALVSAGFYNAGEGRLRCAWCGGELAPFIRFGSLGSPLDIHRMYFPNCAHAAALEAAQRMTHDASPQTTPSYSPPVQTPPNNDADRPQTIGAEQNARFLSGAASGTWKSLGVVGVAGGARHPTRAVLAARLASFDSWPADRTQQPRALAEAGFFYTGTDDQVRCFYCDGGLGKWEAGDVPWSEHAHWFPHCGYVLLIKGQEFVDACRNRQVQRTFSADTGLSSRRRNPGVNFTITDSQVDECMESGAALAALGAGLDAARVRRAITNRLRATGLPFSSSEGLIDAVLDEQLNEESWSVAPQSQRLARDILAETLRDFAHRSGIIPSSDPWESRPDSSISQSESPIRTPTPTAQNRAETNTVSREINANTTEVAPPINHDRPSIQVLPTSSQVYSEIAIADSEVGDKDSKVSRESETQDGIAKPEKKLTLEEENRQLKEARLCKVCMDSEVSVVFLPCGHLVSCARCSAALASCPLCRAAVRALVRAYLA